MFSWRSARNSATVWTIPRRSSHDSVSTTSVTTLHAIAPACCGLGDGRIGRRDRATRTMMAMMTQFVSGLELNAKFYEQVVGPALTQWPHAAARLGWGSEVLGFDTERSTDHGWGPQLVVFVDQGDVEPVRRA